MSANAETLRGSELLGAAVRETTPAQSDPLCEMSEWNLEAFAREQIRGLVRLVFFGNKARPVKQVVFSAAEPQTDVASICDQVGRALALETRGHIAIVGRDPGAKPGRRDHPRYVRAAAIKSWSDQLTINLWRVPEIGLCDSGGESGIGCDWLPRLAQLRTEFEYVVIQGPAAGTSSNAAVLGQLADGIILVLGAHSTRRAAARKVKETLEAAQSRILGTVLSQRTFPIPDRIYRRL
jgi:hypothetical protein